MEQFLGRYRGYRIFSIEELGEFRVEGLTQRFLTFSKAQLAVDLRLDGPGAVVLEPPVPERSSPAPAPALGPAPAPARDLPAPMSDVAQGMAWWGNLSEDQRTDWLQRAGSDIPADAWAVFKAQSR